MHKAFLRVITFVCGILGLILFRWTPATASGLLIYLVLFGLAVVLVFFLPVSRHGYWPGKPEHHVNPRQEDPMTKNPDE